MSDLHSLVVCLPTIFRLSPVGYSMRKRKSLRTEDEASRATLKPLVVRVENSTPEVVQSVLLEQGWDKFDEQRQDVEDWNLYLRTSSFQMVEHANIKPWQRLNHHLGTTTLTRKDHLSLYEFTPLTFVMPSDYTKFVAEYFREKQVLGAKPSYWICKRAELSRGRGIIIFSDIRDLIFKGRYVVQKYICSPLRLAFDCFMYWEGLVWFATGKFDLRSLQGYHSLLTNSSINTSGPSYQKIKEVVGQGCKWTLSRLFACLRKRNVHDLLLWQKIKRMVTLTVLAVAPSVPVAGTCFELVGFDILIDDNLKPWLLEVNYNVSVKRSLIHDVIELEKRCGRASTGSPRVPFARINRLKTSFPQAARTSQLREIMNRQKDLASTRGTAESEPGTHLAGTLPYAQLAAQSLPRKTKGSAGAHPDTAKVPDAHAGNCVLIFPFNEATFGASRHGLNVKRIIPELQKLRNK
uniref:Tubulin tyrosine ligase-like family, member 2 n=1 Tax=Nannospalax galili TaxID=1026970 RepID=A0A8C6W634_NANGA